MLYLIMDRANVSLEVSCSLEAVVAHVTHEVVVLVDATDVVVQIRTTLKLLAAPGAKNTYFISLEKLSETDSDKTDGFQEQKKISDFLFYGTSSANRNNLWLTQHGR